MAHWIIATDPEGAQYRYYPPHGDNPPAEGRFSGVPSVLVRFHRNWKKATATFLTGKQAQKLLLDEPLREQNEMPSEMAEKLKELFG